MPSELRFPVIARIVPQPRWQRSLIPLESLDAIENSRDQPGWIAESCYRIIDAELNVFAADYENDRYTFNSVDQRMTDEDLKEVMCRNLNSIRHDSQGYESEADALQGAELFDCTFDWLKRLPDMSPQMRLIGCTFLLFLVTLAAGIPAFLVWWFVIR